MSSPRLKAPLTRNRYFHGRFLSADDLSNEQSVTHRAIEQLWSRSGFGIVDGLEVRTLDEASCAKGVRSDGDDASGKNVITVFRGQAIDRFGRVLILGDDVQLTIDDDTWSGLWRHVCETVWDISKEDVAEPAPDAERYLCLVRWDERIDRVPVMAAEITDDAGIERGPDNVPFAYSRFAERAQLCLAPAWAIAADAWFYRGDDRPRDRDGAMPDLVPLAKLSRGPKPGQDDDCIDVDLSGRPIATHNHRRPSQLEHAPDIAGLTRIVASNWVHDGRGPWPDPGLSLTFDAPLAQLPPKPAIEVRIERDCTTIDVPNLTLALAPDGMSLTLKASPKDLCPDDLIRLRMNCDFVIDHRGFPIDGAHLRGRLPSGRGLAGDVFESWFWIEGPVGTAKGEVG